MTMDDVLPQRERHYTTTASDSALWDHFTGRDDDIFVCTPPRSGTTWTQTLCCLLLFGWRDFTIKPSEISPWYDSLFHPVEEVNALLDAQDHRRLIKTHTQLDGIPYDQQATYICVYRDPRDVFISMRSHLDNFERVDFELDPKEEISAPFRDWLSTSAANDTSVGRSLEGITLHYSSYRRFSHLPNLHFFHYADMKGDLPAAVARLAGTLGIEVTQDDIAQICGIADFQNMRENATQFTPYAGTGTWKRDETFFNKGVGGQWRDVVGGEDVAQYDERMLELLPAEDIAWLNHGAGQSPTK